MSPSPDPELFLPLPPHVFQILLSLLDGPRHGYSIIKEVEERTDGEVLLGTSTAYSALKRMEKDGLLQGLDAPPESASGGPKRRYHELTELGRRVARAEGLRIARLHRLVMESALLKVGEGQRAGEVGS